jgi:hypothetical protein
VKSLLFALLAISCLGFPANAWAQSPDKKQHDDVSTQQVRKVQRWIGEGENAKASSWLDEHLGEGRWCDAASGVGMKRSELEQFQADLGLLARRIKRADDAMGCLMYSLARRGSSHRAAALYEAYLTLPLLDTDQRKLWIDRMNGPQDEYGRYWPYAKNCIDSAIGPIEPRLACALWKSEQSKLSSTKLQQYIQPLIFAAARLAPKAVYLKRLTPKQRETLKEEALAYLSVEKLGSFESYDEAKAAMREEFDDRSGTSLEPCSRYENSEDVPTDGCYDFAADARDANELEKGRVRLIKAAGGPVLQEHFGTAYHGCHDYARIYLDYIKGDRHAVLDLGIEHVGDNCYVNASSGSSSLTVIDSARGIVRVTIESRYDKVTSHAEPRPSVLTRRDYYCQLGAESAPVECLQANRANHYHSPELYSLVPAISIDEGEIELKKRPGDYYLPEYDTLDGLTLGQAVRKLSAIEKRVADKLEKPTDASRETDASTQ